ncbi:MAG: hypothetical protein KDD48_02555 [Bdellovibrionales bacterium]|nr:hypothetical protein [Bdellovibrionales bacterium]
MNQRIVQLLSVITLVWSVSAQSQNFFSGPEWDQYIYSIDRPKREARRLAVQKLLRGISPIKDVDLDKFIISDSTQLLTVMKLFPSAINIQAQKSILNFKLSMQEDDPQDQKNMRNLASSQAIEAISAIIGVEIIGRSLLSSNIDTETLKLFKNQFELSSKLMIRLGTEYQKDIEKFFNSKDYPLELDSPESEAFFSAIGSIESMFREQARVALDVGITIEQILDE